MMTKGKLKKASQSKTAAKLRKAIGVGPDEEVEVVTPQFERPAGEAGPDPAPRSLAEFESLRTLTDEQRLAKGLRRWGRPEPDDVARSKAVAPKGDRRADLTGLPMLWLFPGEWYASIPEGFEIVTISYRVERFRRGKTDNDIRFGCLAYGILVRDSS